MIGKIINYGTDQLLPEKYRYIGDYACGAIDASTGDYISASANLISGISENLKQSGNENSSVSMCILGTAAGLAGGDIQNAIETGSDGAILSAGAKVGAIVTSTAIGAKVNGCKGAKTGAALVGASIGNDIKETTVKIGLTSTGAVIGYKAKGENTIHNGVALINSSSSIISDSNKMIQNEKVEISDLKDIKQNGITVIKEYKTLTDEEAKNKEESREKLRNNMKTELVDRITDAAISSSQIVADELEGKDTDYDKAAELAGELGHSANIACRIRKKEVEIEDKTYKITDTLCYTLDNYKNIKKEISKSNNPEDIGISDSENKRKFKTVPDRR